MKRRKCVPPDGACVADVARACARRSRCVFDLDSAGKRLYPFDVGPAVERLTGRHRNLLRKWGVI